MEVRENVNLVKGFELGNSRLYCRDYDFGPIDEIIGKTFTIKCEESELELCEKGFHASDCLGKTDLIYPIADKNKRFYKIFVERAFFKEADKFVFKSFTVKKQITLTFDNAGYENTGDYNFGKRNAGYKNTGDYNSGNRNAGDWNTGSGNSGNRNVGNRNVGSRNVGYKNVGDANVGNNNIGNNNIGSENSGNYNIGDANVGRRNAGYSNVGDYNSGSENIGNHNSGDWNCGNFNTGYHNLTDCSSGFFCTERPKAYCFNKITEYTHEEFSEAFAHIIFKKYPCFSELMSLPNATEELVKEYLQKLNNLRK